MARRRAAHHQKATRGINSLRRLASARPSAIITGMTHRLGLLAAAAAFLSIVASSGCAPTMGAREAPAQNATVLALTDVTVIDPAASDPRRPNQTIVIEAGRITSVGPRDSVRIPAGARRVDAAGRYLIPGLWDTHVHFMNAGVTALPLLVANGVTSARDGWLSR